MSSRQNRVLHRFFARRAKRRLTVRPTIADARRNMELLAEQFHTPPGVERTPATIGGVSCEWLRPAGVSSRDFIVYLHGGAYCQGSLVTHRGLGTRLALAAGIAVLMVDYRLAPEFPFPAALDDVIALWTALAKDQPNARIVLAGDSAGGGLAVAACFRMSAAGLRMPVALELICPWVDLACLAQEGAMDRIFDPMKTRQGLLKLAPLYHGANDPRDPLISPLYGDLDGLPPTLLLAAEHDIACDEAERFATRAQASGVPLEFILGREMLHVWPLFAGYLPEADEAIATMGAFARRHLC